EYAVKAELQGIPGSEARAAREVFGKGDDFNASIDPEVRIQYGRLRRKLAEYYATEGKDALIAIILPARKYSPAFVANRTGNEGPAPRQQEEKPNGDPSEGRAQLALVEAAGVGSTPSEQTVRPDPTPEPGVQAIAVL